MATITSLGFNITSNWDGSGVRGARNDLMDLQADMRRISGASLHIDVDVDTSRARAEIEAMRESARDLSVDIDVDLNQSSVVATETAMDTVARDREINVDVDTDSASRGLTHLTGLFGGVEQASDRMGVAAVMAARVGVIAMAGFAASLVALPPAIGLVGAALTGGLAASIIAVGAIALHNDEQIKASWERLKDDGIRIFKEAAAPMRDEFVGALDMIRDRLNVVAPALRDAFANAAPLIRPTTDALLDMAQNALPGIQAAMRNMGPIFTGLQEGMRNFGTSVSNMFTGLSAGAQGFGAIFNTTLTQVGILLDNFGQTAGRMAGDAARLWDGLLVGINGLVKGLLDGFQGLAAAASGPMSNLLRVLGTELGDALRTILPALGEFLAALADLASPVLSTLLPPLAEFTRSALSGLTPAIRGLTPLIVALADGFGTILRWLGPAAPVIVGVTVAWWGLNAALAFAAANPVVAIIAGITALVSGIVYLATRTQFFQTIWRNVWDFVSMRWEQFRSTIVNAWSATWDFLTMRWNQFTGTFSNAWNSLWSGVNSFFQTIWQNIQRSWDTLLNAIRTAWTTTSNAISTAWNAFWGAIKAFAEGIWTSIRTAWDSTLGAIRSVWDTGSSALRSAWEGAWNGIKAVGEGIWNAIKAAWQFHVDGVRQVWDLFSNALRAAWDAFWNGIKALGETIWNAIRAAWNAFTDGLRAIWDFFSNALRQAWDNYWNAVRAAGEAIWNAIRAAWQFLVDTMRQIWDAFSSALRQAWETFWNAIKAVGETIWNGIRGSWDGLFGAFRAIWDTFKRFFEEAWNTMWGGVRKVAEDVWEGLKGGFNDVKDKVIETIDFLVKEVKRIWDQITGFFKDPVDKVKDIWNGVAGTFGLPTIAKANGGEVINRATGGSVHGMGGGVGDRIPAYLSNNEHVLTSDDVDAMGGHSAVYAFRSALHGSANIPGQRVGDIKADNAFAAGGAVDRFDAAVQMAREKGDGRAYVYGGSGPDGFDCSGYMSAIYNILTGRNPWGRSFTTESDFPGMGFVGGLSSRFAVGIHRGGGGPNSHMAGTLGGVNVESGGGHNSTRYGGPAAGANHGQFELQYSLPEVGGQFVSGGGGGSTGPTAEQIAAHDRAVEEIRRIMDATFSTTATMQNMVRSGQIANMNREASPDFIGPLPATHLTEAAKNKFGVFAPAGDTHGAGTGGVGNGAIAKLDAALAALAAQGVGGVLPEGERRALLERALGITSTPPPNTLENWLAGLNTLIQRESGWNAGAVNNWDSNAANGTPSKGLMQLIDPTFRAHHQGGTSDDIFDPLANVSAGINYIKSRYGDISNVQQANAGAEPRGYMSGTGNAPKGWALVGEDGPEMVRFNGGEQVKTFDEIISALKDSAVSGAKELESKVATEIRSMIERLISEARNGNTDLASSFETQIKGLADRLSADFQATGQQFGAKVEAAIQDVLSKAGIQVNMPMQAPPSGADVEQYARQVVDQLVPQLEMMIRQRVGAR